MSNTSSPHIHLVTQGDIDAALLEVEEKCGDETANLLRAALIPTMGGKSGSCPVCRGSGEHVCPVCNGTGYVEKGGKLKKCTKCGGKKKINCRVCNR